jgi:hypothetical protein
VRLIVTDTSAAARALAERLAGGPGREFAVHAVPVYESVQRGEVTRVIGLGGPLFTPRGDPPAWTPARRAAANALRLLARDASSLVLAADDPLLDAQARDVACEGRPQLLRTCRTGTHPFEKLRHVDDLAAEAAAADLEIDAVFATYLAKLDPELRRQDLAALTIAGGKPVARDLLAASGVKRDTLDRLAERGYLVGEPAWWSPAASLVAAALPPILLDPATATRCDRWVDAVARGTLGREEATGRVRDLLDGAALPTAPPGFDAGRLVGPCPDCGDWMGGARERLTCMGCGRSYRLPKGIEILAVPGETCSACSAPLVRPVIRGRRDQPRCPDRSGCPTAVVSRVGS